VANQASNNVSVLLQGAARAFTLSNVAVGSLPTAVALGDIDNDADIDVLVSNSGSNDASVLFNDGAGVFTAGAPLIAGNRPSDVQLGDLNDDGRLDVVVSNSAGQDAAVFFSGVNGFTALTLTAQVGPEAVAIADFNGDTRPDIAIACSSGEVARIFLNQGNQTFSAPADFGISFTAVSMVAGDVDNDQDQDLLVINFDGAGTNLIRNDGAGSFSELETTAIIGDSPTALQLADLDRDGAIDVMMTTTGAVVILANPGNGNFVPQVDLTSGDFLQGLIVVDLDGDGGLDIITANGGSNDLGILFSDF
jgi:hypothetical protein